MCREMAKRQRAESDTAMRTAMRRDTAMRRLALLGTLGSPDGD